MERFRCPGADFFRQCRAINRANARARAHTCVLETQGEPCVALLKVKPETEFTFAALVRTLAALFLSTVSYLVLETRTRLGARPAAYEFRAGRLSLYLKLREIGVIPKRRARDQKGDERNEHELVANHVNNGVLSESGPSQ